MTRRLTIVSAAVIGSPACVPAGKRGLEPGLICGVIRITDIVLIGAFHLLVDSATIAFGADCDTAGCAYARMAEIRTLVFSTSKKVSARLSTTPAVVVISVSALLSERMFAAVARLRRTQNGTRGTWPRMTLKGTRVRAGRSPFGARLAARMRWDDTAGTARTGLFATPTLVVARLFGQEGVASRASPRFFSGFFVDLHGSIPPLVGTFEMDNSPAERARPDFGLAGDLLSTDATFIVPVVNVLLDALPELGGCGLGNFVFGPLLLLRSCSRFLWPRVRCRLRSRLRLLSSAAC